MSNPKTPFGYRWLDKLGLPNSTKQKIMKHTDAMMQSCQQYVSTGSLACVAMVLCDKYGDGDKVNDIIHLASDMIESVNQKYVNIEDLIDAMIEEYGVNVFRRVEGGSDGQQSNP